MLCSLPRPFSLFEPPSLMPFRLQQTSLGPLAPGGGVGSEIRSHRGLLSLVGEAGLVWFPPMQVVVWVS